MGYSPVLVLIFFGHSVTDRLTTNTPYNQRIYYANPELWNKSQRLAFPVRTSENVLERPPLFCEGDSWEGSISGWELAGLERPRSPSTRLRDAG